MTAGLPEGGRRVSEPSANGSLSLQKARVKHAAGSTRPTAPRAALATEVRLTVTFRAHFGASRIAHQLCAERGDSSPSSTVVLLAATPPQVHRAGLANPLICMSCQAHGDMPRGVASPRANPRYTCCPEGQQQQGENALCSSLGL